MKALVKFGGIMAILLIMALLCLVGVMCFINGIIAVGRGDYFMVVICAISWVWLCKPMKNCVETLVMAWNKKL